MMNVMICEKKARLVEKQAKTPITAHAYDISRALKTF